MTKITTRELQALGAADHGTKLRDDAGLFGTVRAGAKGVSVHFDYRYRSGGKVKQIAVGTWPKLSLAAIRSERDRLKVEIDGGGDPAERRKAERLEAQAERAERIAEQKERIATIAAHEARITIADVFERWAKVDLIRRKDGGKEVRRMFEKDVLPHIGHVPAEDLRKGHLTAVTDELLARGVKRMAKVIFSLMRQMLRFAVDRDIIELDPSSAIRKASIGGKDTERDRVLTESEIKQLKAQLPQSGLILPAQSAVWIVLSTCCRIGELMAARWDDIDLAKRLWRIPAENSKNGKPHTIHLSDFAAEHFNALEQFHGATPWAYPNRAQDGPVCSRTLTKQIGDRQREGKAPMRGRAKGNKTTSLVLPGGKWGPHDLRRTGATMMVTLGVLPEVAERCLNHTEQNRVKRIYQRYSYEAEMREAWQLLSERLELLTRDDAQNVVPLRSNTVASR